MGGATNIGHFLGRFGPRGFGVRLAGLCDEGEQRLRRFMGTRSGRKIHYGHVLAAALDLNRVPGPLAGVLSRV